jgi:hypothetical protein
MQTALWWLSRVLDRRLRPSVVAAGLLLPHLVLAPWFSSQRILLPTIIVERTFPGAPRVASDSHHAVLNDAVFQFVPWESEVRAALREGRLPLWSDQIDGGSSPWANPQAQVLSPVKFLARLVPIEDSLATVMVLTMIVAFEGTWVAARLFGASSGVALLAACGFAFGGGTMAWSVLPNSTTIAWAPWLLSAVLRLVRRPRWGFLAASSVLTMILAFSGHPETAAAAGLLAVVCGLSLGRSRGGRLRGVAAAALAAVLGLGMAAAMIVPFTHAVLKASRVDESSVRPLPRKEVSWDAPSTWFVGETPRILLQVVAPHGAGTPFVDPSPSPVPWPVTGSLYCGLAVFAGVAAALCLRRRRTLPLLGFAVVGCLLSVRPIPLEHVLLAMPGVQIIVFNRVLPAVSLCYCLVGALGLGRLISGRPRRIEVAAAMVAAIFSLVVSSSTDVAILWAALLISLFVARWRPRFGLALVTVVVLVDLVPWARDMLPVGDRELFYPPTAVTGELVRRTSRDGPWRVVATATGYYPSSLAMHGLEDIRYHNPLVPHAYARLLADAFGFHDRRVYFGTFRVSDHPMLDFLNVRIVAVRGSQRIPAWLRRTRFSANGVRLARNPDALRRFFVAPSAEVVPRTEVTSAVADLTDARRVVLVAEELEGWVPPQRRWLPRAVRVESLAAGAIDLSLPKKGDKLLATSLGVPEGWEVTSGGRPLKKLTVNGAFVGAVVPAGTAEVRLRFVPPGLRLGFLLSLISVIALGVFAFVPWRCP